MTEYERWDIILVPFPFTDLSQNKRRPALLLSPGNEKTEDIIILYITSKMDGLLQNGDYVIKKWESAGLPLPSKTRMKMATILKSMVVKKIGKLEPEDQKDLAITIKGFLLGE